MAPFEDERRTNSDYGTLARGLAFEGTEFAAELDAVRRDRAMSRVRAPGTTIAVVAFRNRFSHVESFHRAFKRWTGRVPGVFRARLGPDTTS